MKDKIITSLAVLFGIVGIVFLIGPSIYHVSQHGVVWFDWTGSTKRLMWSLYWEWYLGGMALISIGFAMLGRHFR